MIALSLAALLSAPVAHAAPAAPSEQDYRGILDQARFQIRKEFWEQAEIDLLRATAHPDGANDAEAWFLLAQVRLMRSDLPGALDAGERAQTNARTPDQAEQSAALVSFLRTDFGLLTVTGAQPGLRWHPRLELRGMIVDPEQQAWVERLEHRLRRDRPQLPVTIGLPATSWTVNGTAVELANGERVSVELSPSAASGGLALARLAWLELGTGVTFWLGGGAHLLPSPTGHLALNVPVGGPFVVALLATSTPTTIRDERGGYSFDGRASTAGLRFGPLLDDGEQFLFRPAVGYRYGTVAGLRLGCTRDEPTFVCGDGPVDRVVYASGPAHVLHAELALDILDRRRTKALGGGVKVVGEHALARLPDSVPLRDSDADSVSLDPSARRPSLTALTALVHLSIAF